LTHYNTFDLRRILKIFNYKKKGRRVLNLQKFFKYQWILSQGDFDIFHAHFGTNATYVAEMRNYGFYKKTKFISTFHGYDLAPEEMKRNENKYKSLFKEVDLITVNTPYLYSLLRQITDRNAVILPVGLNISTFKESP